MNLAFWQQCIVDENFPVQSFFVVLKKIKYCVFEL